MARVRFSPWKKVYGYIEQGYNVPVLFKQYLNFGSTSGESGYGIRDEAGVVQIKNQSGSWTPIPLTSSIAWGSVTGNLSDQLDLQSALDAKATIGIGVSNFSNDAGYLTSVPSAIDATKIANGSVSNAEFQYLDGVSSALQTQINGKQSTLISGTNIKTINGSSILGSGDLTVSGTMAIGGSITSATAGSVLFAGASGVLQQDNANFFWDDTNNLLGIGTNAPSTSYRMDIKSASTSLAGLRVYGGGPTGGAPQIGSGEIRLGNGATDFGNLAYNNQNGNVYLDNGYSGGSIFLRVGGVSLLGTSSTGATANASTSSGTGLVVGGGSSLENHLLGGEIRLGIAPGAENVLLAYGASSGDFYLKNVYSGGKFRFYIGSTQHMTLFSSGSLSIGTTSETAKLSIIKTSEQLRLGYDASNRLSITVGSTGGVTFDAVGSGAGFTFSDPMTINGLLTLSAQNIATDTTTGMKIGTSTTQKIGFYNATPIVQGASVADATGGVVVDSEARTAINSLISRIEAIGLIATV